MSVESGTNQALSRDGILHSKTTPILDFGAFCHNDVVHVRFI